MWRSRAHRVLCCALGGGCASLSRADYEGALGEMPVLRHRAAPAQARSSVTDYGNAVSGGGTPMSDVTATQVPATRETPPAVTAASAVSTTPTVSAAPTASASAMPSAT